MTTRSYGPRRALDFLLKVDPGYANFKAAFRGTITILIAFLVLASLASHLQQPPTLAFLGVMIAMLGAMVVGDSTEKQQKTTLLLIPVPAALGLISSIALGAYPNVQLAAFLLVTFLAVALRRFGLRWFGLGFIAFMAFCAPLFFPIHSEAIPWVVGAVILAVAIGFTIRFVIFPERPRRKLRSYLRSLHLQNDAIVHELARTLRSFTKTPSADLSRKMQKSRARFRCEIVRVNELSLTIEQFLNSGDSPLTKAQGESLQMSLFERELSIRQLLYAIDNLISHPEAGPGVLKAVADAVSSAIHSNSISHGFQDGESDEVRRLIENFHVAIESFSKDRNRSITDDVSFLEVEDESSFERPLPKAPAKAVGPVSKELHFNTKQAIQATLATALASLIGISVSPQRWYWASIAAFVVFAGATRGDTLRRAFLRIVGTLVGLVAGFLLAYLFSGHKSLEWGLVLVCIFFGIYGMRMAFGFWTATLFTMMLAVLYNVMGLMTPELLILRLEETVVGAAAGALMSAYVLPTSTSLTIRTNLANCLRAMSEVFAELPLDPSKRAARKVLVRRIVAMDRELMSLRAVAAPVVGKVSLMKQGDLPGALFDASILGFLTRYLATYTGSLEGLSDEQLRTRCVRLSEQMHRLADQLSSKGISYASDTNPRRTGPAVASSPTLTHVFERVSQVLDSLGSRKI